MTVTFLRTLFIVVILSLLACDPTVPTSSPSPISPLEASRVEHQLFLPAVNVGSKNLLLNPSFEMGEWHYSIYWDENGGPWWISYEEVRPPIHWIAFWYEGIEGICTGSVPGRPEFLAFEKWIDSRRVLSGKQSAKYFTFWRCQRAGLMQPVKVSAGQYQASAFVQTWHSDCSTKPYDPPLNYDCKTPLSDRLEVQIGIDPLGGYDPAAASIVWGSSGYAFGEFAKIVSPIVEIEDDSEITLFLLSKSEYALKHEDVYIDSVQLVAR